MRRIYVFLSTLMFVVGLNAQQDALLEKFEATAAYDLSDKQAYAVDIKNVGTSVEDCQAKAEIQALFAITFLDITKSNKARGSFKLAQMTVFEGPKKADFINFFNGKLKTQGGGAIIKSEINVNFPPIKKEKKKYETVTTVHVNKMMLRSLLEQGKMIESAAEIVTGLGYKPTVFIVPGDLWMEQAGWMKDGQTDYLAVSSDDLAKISQKIEARFKDVFVVKTLKQAVDNIKVRDAQSNNRSKYGKQVETDNQSLSRSAQADIWLKINYDKPKNTGINNVIELSLKAEDPYNDGASVAITDVHTIRTVGNDPTAIRDAAVNSACDEFESSVLSFFKERETKGLLGRLSFISVNPDVDFKLNTVNYNGQEATLEEVLPVLIESKILGQAQPAGIANETEMPYIITIPTKTKNLAGKVVAYNFQTFAADIIKEIKKLGGNFDCVTEQLGVGDVQILFTQKKQ
jgi:hypothetical protein